MNLDKTANIERIVNFSWHDSDGNVILHDEWLKWFNDHHGYGFGPVTKYSWSAGGTQYEIPVDRKKFIWEVLPDSSGFICFESESKPDNCTLLDAYGKERMRLTVPWQMTGSTSPESGLPPTSFENISAPYINPVTGEEGKFGVTAWVEYAGKHYFELDYHTGQFLWCKRIMD